MRYDYTVGDVVVCVNDVPNFMGKRYVQLGKMYKVVEMRTVPPHPTQFGVTDIVVIIDGFQGGAAHPYDGFHPCRFRKLPKANIDIFKLATPRKVPEHV